MKTQRIVSNPIGAGSLSADGSETFAHYHIDGQMRDGNHGGGLVKESSSTKALEAKLSCNMSFEEFPDEKSKDSVGATPPEAEESVMSVSVRPWAGKWGGGDRLGGSEEGK